VLLHVKKSAFFVGRSGDIKCKKKELFVILDLYKNYRELKDYHNLLLQIKENVTVTENGNQLDISGNQTNIGKAMDGSNNSKTLDYTGRYVDPFILHFISPDLPTKKADFFTCLLQL
jgi:hypothetical protein